jgi:hypothetical protein
LGGRNGIQRKVVVVVAIILKKKIKGWGGGGPSLSHKSQQFVYILQILYNYKAIGLCIINNSCPSLNETLHTHIKKNGGICSF